LRTGSGDVASQNQQLWIEGMQEAHDRGSQVVEGAIQDAPGALVSVGCGTKDGLCAWRLAGAVS